MLAEGAAVSDEPLALTIAEHFRELRGRLLVIAVVLLTASSVAFYYNERLIDILQRPFQQTLYYSSPAGGFTFSIATSLLAGAIVTLPFLIYHLLAFVRPAMPTRSLRNVWKLVVISLLLSGAGLLFAYKLSLPLALEFLKIFATEQIQPLIAANDYLSFISYYLLGFALLFEIPLIMYVINLVTPLGIKALFKFEMPMILIAFILAAILTPTGDPLNQTLMAGPIILLYQFGILAIVIRRRRLRRRGKIRTINEDIRAI